MEKNLKEAITYNKTERIKTSGVQRDSIGFFLGDYMKYVGKDANPDSLGVELERLPKSLSESVEALEKDTILKDLIGEKLLIAIKGVRKAEIKYYSENENAYKKLIHQY
ncbi:unnamed protein product [Ilex paraguariensis]|uniref:GS catalytic domain-containing protein n=1 Tax=Ilex paraguariensis TaxID=185542 RepID=A0ABC8SF05_9AQUA